MELREIQQLISKYLSGKATDEEINLVEQWYETTDGDDDNLDPVEKEKFKSDLYTNLLNYIETPPTKTYPFYFNKTFITAAAAVLVLVMAGLFYINRSNSTLGETKTTAQLVQDIHPGGNKATLVLADGSVVVLDDAQNGKLANQGNTAIQKSADGIVTYNASKTLSNPSSNAINFNTISTPRGGQYIVILPDGSKVWLNAASSLKFPTAFNGKERNVELVGEAYFEVTKNAAAPFRVKSATQVIEVLGTHFNVNAYNDEPTIKTTLLEGTVRIKCNSETTILKPGQQASALPKGTIEVSNDVDAAEITAWKNGVFQFNEADIETVMRQISRWYDVDIEFEGKIPDDHFKGKVSRNVNVSQVLKIIELSGVKFKIEGKKIIVK